MTEPEQQITAHQATARQPLTEGPCPECGEPATYSTLGSGSIVVLHADAADHQACPLVIEATAAAEQMLRTYRDLMPPGDAPALGIITRAGDPAIADDTEDPRSLYERIRDAYHKVASAPEAYRPPAMPRCLAERYNQILTDQWPVDAEIMDAYDNAVTEAVKAAGESFAAQQVAALSVMRPGHRLCVHEMTTDNGSLRPDSDVYTMRFRRQFHRLAPGEICHHRGEHTEYFGMAIDSLARDEWPAP